MKVHGTRIVIYNLREDDQGLLELDFDTDPHDIQLRGVNRDEKKINMATQFPNSRPFVTYKHSLRMSAVVTIGFVKVAKHHIDVQGFNVYHKNRLIKISLTKLYPTYYVTYFGSDGRGVIAPHRDDHFCTSSNSPEKERRAEYFDKYSVRKALGAPKSITNNHHTA
uniref:Morc S5 domain-containing protein n=2 Tax=Brassica oleracea TaxID=3712 RepID=A0A0D3E9R7_BRAOL|nr:unnamed protein product [Brassica oleracea]